jgi:hypothetical protein
MSFRNKSTSAVAIVAVSILCGCTAPNATMPSVGTSKPAGAAAVPEKSGGKTVVVVTDSGTNEAEMLAYPSGTLLHTLGGFSEPQGACSDGAGHFWITNTGDSNVLEYSTGGTLLETLNDAHNYPVGCAYDPKTGDLAVTNIITTADGPGNVAMYANATGTPKLYTTSLLQRVYFASFAGSTGTLVISGENSSSESALASLTNGKFTSVMLKGGTIEFPGGVAWSTKIHSMNVEDQTSSVIYHIKLNGKVTGTTKLDCGCDIVTYAIFGGTLLVPTNQGIEVFPYPAGGSSEGVITKTGFDEPIGIAVSSAVTE